MSFLEICAGILLVGGLVALLRHIPEHRQRLAVILFRIFLSPLFLAIGLFLIVLGYKILQLDSLIVLFGIIIIMIGILFLMILGAMLTDAVYDFFHTSF
jgi:hypothetical protein